MKIIIAICCIMLVNVNSRAEETSNGWDLKVGQSASNHSESNANYF